MKKKFKILGYTFAFLIYLLVLLAGFTQTKLFKDKLRYTIASVIASNTGASLSLGKIKGNFITGCTIDSLNMQVGEDEWISSGTISVSYDLLAFLRKHIVVHRLTIQNPHIVLKRGEDSVWNIDKLTKTAAQQISPAVPAQPGPAFDWSIRIDTLKLVNGSIEIRDPITLASPEHKAGSHDQVEYHDIAVSDVQLECGGEYRNQNARLAIRRLKFESTQPRFELRQLRGEISVTPKSAAIHSLDFETSRSRLKLSASLENINMFDGFALKDLRQKPVRVNLLADDIDLSEFKSFLAPVGFLSGSAHVDLDARGEFGDLSIERLDVETYNTSIKLRGSLQNLHKPENLVINVAIRDSHVDPADASRLLPPFQIPRFENAGTFAFDGQFVGRPLNFEARISGSGELGSFQSETHLDLEKNQLKYECSFSTRNLQIGKMLNTPLLQGLFTSNGTIEGSGTSPQNLNAFARISIDSSVLRGNRLVASGISIDARNKHLETVVKLNSDDMKATFTGAADFHDDKNPSFRTEVDLMNIDLARVLDDIEFKSNITLHASAAGSLSTLDDLSGSSRITFSSSSFQQRQFGGEEIVLKIDQNNPKAREITLTSPVADARIAGEFSPVEVVQRVIDEGDRVARALHARAAALDSVHQPTKALKNLFYRIVPNQTPSKVQYSSILKNLEPIYLVFGGTPFNARGSLEGSLVSKDNKFSLSFSTALRELFMGAPERGLLLEGVNLTFKGESNSVGDYLKNLSLDVTASANSGHVNKHALNTTALDISYNGSAGKYSLQTTIDSLVSVATEGQIEIFERAYDLTLKNVGITFGSVSWKNDGDQKISIDPAGIHIKRFELARENQRLSWAGTLNRQGALNAQLTLRQFDLAGLGHFFRVRELIPENRGFSGSLDLMIDLQGTSSSPIIHLATSSSELGYRGKRIGTLEGSFAYLNQTLSGEIKITGKNGNMAEPPRLKVSGSLPIDLAFTPVEKRFPDQLINLSVMLNSFEVNGLDPFLASFDELQGQAAGDLNIGGTPNHPKYNGSISLAEVRFLFVPNNIFYNLSGTLEAQEDKINLVQVQISNDPQDRKDGNATVAGSLAIRDFTISSFDLSAQGQLLLISKSTRQTLRSMYGTLVAAIAPEGLRYRGSFAESYLNGKVFIKEANIIFPATKENLYSGGDYLNYVVVDDTSKDRSQKLSQQYFGNGSPSRPVPTNGEGPLKSRRTIWDGLVYDVNIETQGTTEIRMIFDQATNEELYAQLDGKVILQKGETGANLTGEIAVSERSYYNFFKRFNASGKLKFVGLPDNPELDVKAVYQATHRPAAATTDTGKNAQQPLTEEKVVVTLNITGTRYEPKISMAMTVDDTTKTGDVQSDAIAFILTGKFRHELTSREKSDLVTSLGSSAGNSLIYGLPSQMLSSVLSEFLREEFGFIHSAEVTYQGGGLQESADLRLSGEVFRAYWRFGGRIFNDIGNANVSFQLSMGEILSTPQLRDLFIELERKVEGTEYFDQKKLTNSARLYYRFSF